MISKIIEIRAAGYARFSSGKQNSASADDQLREVERYAIRNGITLVASFRDEAISGAYERGRSGFAELKKQAELGLFQILICESIDRLGRNVSEVTAFCRRLKFHGIEVHTYTGGKQSDIAIGLMSVVAEAQLESTKINTRRGGISSVKRGRNAGGRSYGYRLDPKIGPSGQIERGHLKIHPDEAAIIRRIYGEYAGGKSPVEIARDLNRDGVRGPRRRRRKDEISMSNEQEEFSEWQASTILGHARRGTGILRNPLYRGERVYNKMTYDKHPDTASRLSRSNSEEEIIQNKVPELRIVTDEQWAAVRKREKLIRSQMSVRSGSPRVRDARRPTSFLSGLIQCAVCGGHVGLVLRDRWGCLGYHGGKNCSNKRTKKRDVVEQRILSGLVDRLVTSEMMIIAVGAYQAEKKEIYERWCAQADTSRKKIAELDVGIKNLLHVIESGHDVPEVSARLAELSKQRQALIADAPAMPAPVPELPADFDATFRKRALGLTEVLRDPDLGREASDTLRRLISAVVFRPGETRGQVGLTLSGNLAAILAMAAGNDNVAVMTEAVACPRNH